MFVETKEAGEVAEAPAKVLKLSEAIRIGARIRPQCFGQEWEDGKSCAMAAAAEAIGARYGQFIPMAWAMRKWPEVMRDTFYKAATMNDSGVSREAVADWLEAQGY